MGTAEWYYTFPQDQEQGHYYWDSYYPSEYWIYPYVPVNCAVQATKERLWFDTYENPNSVHWQVQEAKERLWAVKNACYGCWPDYGWREGGHSWDRR